MSALTKKKTRQFVRALQRHDGHGELLIYLISGVGKALSLAAYKAHYFTDITCCINNK